MKNKGLWEICIIFILRNYLINNVWTSTDKKMFLVKSEHIFINFSDFCSTYEWSVGKKQPIYPKWFGFGPRYKKCLSICMAILLIFNQYHIFGFYSMVNLASHRYYHSMVNLASHIDITWSHLTVSKPNQTSLDFRRKQWFNRTFAQLTEPSLTSA